MAGLALFPSKLKFSHVFGIYIVVCVSRLSHIVFSVFISMHIKEIAPLD